MAFVQFSKVSLSFGDKKILNDVSVNLKTGTKAALTGANGAGKSTLIKIMAGLQEPDSGERIAQKDARIAYLPQSGLTHSGSTLKEEADRAFEYGYKIQEEIDTIGDALKENPSNSKELLERHAALLASLESSGWYRREALAESVLLGLGFDRKDFDKMTDEFSGGWQMRIALAKALMQGPDILLLDEPTNYLDLEARAWLETFLQNYKGGFLLVSHDRYFLDVTINEVYELFNGQLNRYPGNYSHYEKTRESELKTLMAEYQKQQEEIAHLQSFIDRFGYKASKAVQAQSRQKMLDKIVPIEIPESLKKIHFKFPAAPHSGQIVLRLNGLTKSYDGATNVLDKLDLQLENGERLVVVGHNGAGKSTLLRIVAGVDNDFNGEKVLGAGVAIGYFSQDSAETIKGSESVLECIENVCPLDLVPKARDMLGAFLFRGDDVFKSLDVLSGGEKSRVALLRLLLKPINLLILDEPTNHLDMNSKDALLEALKDFGGTVIFVSHDRGFIQDLATRVLELTPGHARNFLGGYEYYLERVEAESSVSGTSANANGSQAQNSANKNSSQAQNAASGNSKQNQNAAASQGSAANQKASSNQNAGGGKSSQNQNAGASANAKQDQKSAAALSWEEQKKAANERKRLERLVESLGAQIEEKEAAKKVLEEKMSDPAVYSNGAAAKEVQAQIAAVDAELEALTADWEKAAEELG